MNKCERHDFSLNEINWDAQRCVLPGERDDVETRKQQRPQADRDSERPLPGPLRPLGLLMSQFPCSVRRLNARRHRTAMNSRHLHLEPLHRGLTGSLGRKRAQEPKASTTRGDTEQTQKGSRHSRRPLGSDARRLLRSDIMNRAALPPPGEPAPTAEGHRSACPMPVKEGGLE